MKLKKILLIFLFLGLSSTAVFANDVMFSIATFPVVGSALFFWLFIGVVVKSKRPDLVLVGWISLVGGLVLFLLMHFEFIFICWMIYLALLVVYFAFPRKGIPVATRQLNGIFHGLFLAVVIVGGIIAKMVYYSHQGGFVEWSARTVEYYPVAAWSFFFFMLFVSVAFHSKVVRRKWIVSSKKVATIPEFEEHQENSASSKEGSGEGPINLFDKSYPRSESSDLLR